MKKVNLLHKFSLFNDHWSPKIVGELNGQQVKLVKLEGEFLIIPKGVEHKPVAENEAWIMLFEPSSTLNTGNVIADKTKMELERI